MAFFAFSMFNPLDFVDRSRSQMPQNMGHMEMPFANQARAHGRYCRPWRHIPRQQSETSNLSFDKKHFQIELDVQRYAPGEISVKTSDNHIVVEGKHEEKEDEHGCESRHFSRRYTIPKGVQAESITSTMSTDGFLTVLASTVPAMQGKNERKIPIAATRVRAKK